MENSAYLSLEQNSSQLQPQITEFSHQPITHQIQTDKQQMAMFKKFVRNIEIQQRKRAIQKKSHIQKQLLQAQIQTKNFRSQLLRPATQFQPNRGPRQSHQSLIKHQNIASQKKIKPQLNQKSMSTDIIKPKPQKILKIQVPTLKGQPYVDKDKLMRKPFFGSREEIDKENRVKLPPREFSGIKLRNLKLPELSLEQPKTKKQPADSIKQNKKHTQMLNKPQTAINSHKQLKIKQKVKNEQINLTLASPVLKTYDNLYFGIERERKDYNKEGKSLLESVKEKYWNYDNLQNEEVLESFEDYLTGLVQTELLKK